MNSLNLPAWSQAARQITLIQPSERVLSLLTNSFGERQNSTLQDYIAASIMMQYNNRDKKNISSKH